MDKDKKTSQMSKPASEAETPPTTHLEEFFRSLQPEMQRGKPNSDAIAAAMEAAERLAAEADAEQVAEEAGGEMAGSGAVACRVCGHRNRSGNRFCAMCGVVLEAAVAEAGPSRSAAGRSGAQETHHYHHHYHHHYLPGGYEGVAPHGNEPVRYDPAREERMKPTAALRGDMSRAEAAVRRVTHEWVLACNTKHLDDLLDLYAADALVLRSNYPPVRGAAAVREFFFGALDAGLGEVEMEPLRVEIAGDMAYEAGRSKALVPGATGKRREERGKYLWVLARQTSGEWRVAADCWSSDLSFTTLESDVPHSAGVKTREPRRG